MDYDLSRGLYGKTPYKLAVSKVIDNFQGSYREVFPIMLRGYEIYIRRLSVDEYVKTTIRRWLRVDDFVKMTIRR